MVHDYYRCSGLKPAPARPHLLVPSSRVRVAEGAMGSSSCAPLAVAGTRRRECQGTAAPTHGLGFSKGRVGKGNQNVGALSYFMMVKTDKVIHSFSQLFRMT